MKRYLDQTYLLLIIPVLCETLPWLRYRLKLSVPFFMILLWAISMFCQNIKPILGWRRFSKYFWLCLISLVAYTFSQELWALFNHGSRLPYRLIANPLLQGSYLLIPYLSFKYDRLRELKWISILALIGYILTGILTIRTAVATGGLELSRTLTSEDTLSSWYSNDVYTAKVGGVGNYDYVYTAALMAPILMLMLLSNVKRHVSRNICLLFVAAAGAMWIIVKSGGLGTPVFVLMFTMLLSLYSFFVRHEKQVKLMGTIMISGLFIFMYAPSVLKPFSIVLSNIGEMFQEGGSIRTRFATVAEALNGDENTYAYKRYDLQRRSLDAFFSAPLFGIGSYSYETAAVMSSARQSRSINAKSIGGHSMLLDRMGSQGMFGSFTYFLYLFFLVKFFRALPREPFPNKWMIYPLVYVCSFIFTSITNPFNAFFSIAYFLPGMALLVAPIGTSAMIDRSSGPVTGNHYLR